MPGRQVMDGLPRLCPANAGLGATWALRVKLQQANRREHDLAGVPGDLRR
ncbi:hypothetical protein [Candidatus Methylacidithermus pantelleriae]|nr:hypothetical protein [Candidatus Methylacidithermus pantelleriae]